MANAKFVLIPEQPEAPALAGKIPGPKAAEWVARDQQVMSPSYTRDYPLVIDRAIGSVVTDADGNRFLDLTAGIAVTSTGHCHPHVVEAITKQAGRFLHMSGTDFYYDQEILLAERLARLAPMSGKNRVFFTNSGAEAIEAAFKLARHQTGRQHVIAFWGAFHGRTFGAMSLSGSKAIHRKRFMPMVPQITHVTYPNPYRHGRPQADKSLTEFTLDEIEHTVFRREVGPDEVAAIFVEPIQGEGGYLVPPPISCPGSANCAAATESCWSATKCNAAWAGPAKCGPSSTSASSPTSLPWPRGSPAGCRWAPSWPARKSWIGRPAPTPRRSAATRWPAPPPWPRSICSKAG